MNKLAKRIWNHSWSTGRAGLVYADEDDRFERFTLPDDTEKLICRLFDISKTHKAIMYGCLQVGFSDAPFCPVLQICKNKCAGMGGYDIDAELVEAFVKCSGGNIDRSTGGKETS